MRERLILAGLGILMIVAAAVIFALSRIDPPPPPPPASSLVDDHDHAVEILPPAPVGRTLFGGNSGRLRASPAAASSAAAATPVNRSGTPISSPSDVFAPARFQATPAGG